MRKSKRTLLKSKVYGFNPWTDQVAAINQIMEETGQKSEAAVLRELIDEAITIRRRKAFRPEEPPPSQELSETLHTLQTLLLRIIGQGEESASDQNAPSRKATA